LCVNLHSAPKNIPKTVSVIALYQFTPATEGTKLTAQSPVGQFLRHMLTYKVHGNMIAIFPSNWDQLTREA
jgi:hypothetical protein